MRNLKFYGLLIIMLLSIFLLSGCGGSVRDSESGSTDDQSSSQETPNSLPDTRNIAQILKGTWIGINGSGTVQDSSAASYTWDVIQAAINFSNVNLSGNSGTATVTSLYVCSVKDPSGIYVGTERIYRESRSANMVRAGSDSWICEYNDREGEKHVLTIDVTDKTSYSYIKITEKGEIENPEFDYTYYEMTVNLRHSDSENDTIEPISDSNPPEIEEPVDFAKIIDATWLGLDGTGTVQDSSANSYTWDLARAAINFSGTQITGNTGTTTITSLLIWSVRNSEGAYVGNEKIYRDSRPATMIKKGDYSWICEYSDSQGERHVMSIDVTDKDSYSYVKISEKGSIENPDFNYNYYEMNANLIRSDLSKSSIESISDSVEPANVARVLNATWLGLNGSGNVSDSEANAYTWDLSRALINFSNTSLGERTGTTILTTLYVWTVKDSSGAYIGNERIYRSSLPATMLRTAANSWVCEYTDSQGKRHVMNIEITDDDSYSYISVAEKGEIENPDFSYNYYEMTADFVRSDSGSWAIAPIDDKPNESDSDGNNGNNNNENNNQEISPDIDIAEVLNSKWIGLTGEGTALDSSDASEYTWDLARADLTFSGTTLTGDTGTTTITSHFIWSVKNPDGVYIGAERINHENQRVSMIRQGNNIWICEYEDSTGKKHTITLTITGQDSYTYLTIEEKGPAEKSNSKADSSVTGYNYYEMQANFRRETYYTPSTN